MRTLRALFLPAALLVTFFALDARAGRASGLRAEAAVLLDEGVSAYNRMEYMLAVEKLRKSAAIALNSFRAYYYLGLALTADRRYHEATTALNVALDLDPANVQAHIATGNAYLKEGDTQEAEASFARALKLRAEYPSALDGMARVHEARADEEKAVELYRRAIELYRRAIASNSGFAESYVHLGNLLLREDRYEEAVQLLHEAVTIRADFAYAYNGLAAAYGKLGLENEAVATIRKAIDLEPRSPDHWTLLGQVELQMGLTERAEGSFRKAAELDPTHPDARAGLAETARRRGDYAAAAAELAAALADPRLDPREVRRLEERRSAVEAEAREAAELEARIASGEAAPEAVRRLAAIRASRGLYGEAADLQARTEPAGTERERLAYYLLKAGRNREAQALYAELARGAPRADLEINVGIALAGLGDHAGAAAAYRRALELDDAHSVGRLYLGNALLRLGRREEAVSAYRKYLADVPKGSARARIVRILGQIAPDAVPAEAPPSRPPGMGVLPSSPS